MELGIGSQAFLWGVASAMSLPLGAFLGLWLRPKQKVNSAFMAFGAGALLFALTIELFGHVPDHVEEHGLGSLLAAGVGALTGGLLFDLLNQMLNNRGAFLRSLSSAKRFVGRLKWTRSTRMINELSRVKVLNSLPPKSMARLVQRVQRESFVAHQEIFSQGSNPEAMYFVVSGKVEVIKGGQGKDKFITRLGEGETFGELGVLTGQARSASIRTLTPVVVYKINKSDFDEIFKDSPEMQKALRELASERVNELEARSKGSVKSEWRDETLAHLEAGPLLVSREDIVTEGHGQVAAGGAAMAIWLGLLIDSVPESMVIGLLATSVSGMSYAFIAGVFLANLPEAMSSAVTMRRGGMSLGKIFMMWSSITVVTGIGAFIGAVGFSPDPSGAMFYFVLGIEGLAAGAMLTMIAETMLPEAFEQGGSIVGFSTLCGFLAALIVKVI